MHTAIEPVLSSFKFGTADTLLLRSVSDNLSDSATFFWQLGKMVKGEENESFVGDDSATGNAFLSGEAYAKWSGANDALPALVVSQIGVTLA